MSNTDLDRRAAEMLGKFPCSFWTKGTPAHPLLGSYTAEHDNLKAGHSGTECFSTDPDLQITIPAYTTDWRQAGPMLEMIPHIVLENYEGSWDGQECDDGKYPSFVGRDVKVVITQVFCSWLEPMTPDERKKALGRG